MKCLKCGIQSSIDCQVFRPGESKCLRCGQEMSREQKREWEKYWEPFLGKKMDKVDKFFLGRM